MQINTKRGFITFVVVWLTITTIFWTWAAGKPDVHCVLKSRTTFAENKGEWDCQYKCANGKKTQVILSKKYKCPARLFEKDKS
jgi:hypothetical protein|tara:strand:+ start:27 stop:275 length:249 start_codon:yes stop_codon:yes gene_type:complete